MFLIGMTCVTTQTVALKCFLQHWYDLCYNTNSCFEMFLATLVWLVLQHKQLLWTVSCNIGMTCVTTQTVGLNCFLQHWYDLCYNTNSCSELFLTTLVWLVLQHKQLLWIVSCNIGMTCVTTQTVGLNCFLQHWYDLCYNTNSCFEMFLATLVWLVLQHKQLLWNVSCNIGMTCVTTQTVGLKCFLQHWYDLCYNTNSCFELFLATLVWLVLQHKQLLWNVSCNIGMTCVTTQTVALKCFLQHWYDLCYNTNSCLKCFLQHWYDLCYNTNSWSEMFLTTLVWLVLQHKQLLWTVSCNIGMTCVTTQTVALNCFLQLTCETQMFLATLVWLVLQHKQLVWIVSYNIGMTCVTTQTVGLNCFLQHWHDLCYNTNSCFEMFLTTLVWLVLQHKQLLAELFLATLVWLVLQHKQLLWNVSCNIGMTCVTTQTVGLKCFLQHWYDLCYNTNSWSEMFLTTLVWLVLQHKQLLWNSNIGMTCVTTQTVELFLATLVWLVLQHKQLLWNVSCNIGMTCVTTQTVALNCFLQHWYDLCYNTNRLVWIVSCNIGMTCVTTQTVSLNCFLQHWYDLCYNTNSWSELFLTTLVWLVLQHKQLVCIVSNNIGMTSVTTQTVALKCFLQHWYDLCYNTNSCFEMFLTTLVWLVLQHKQLVWNVSCNIGMTCVTTQTVALNCFLQHWYDLCYNTNSCFELFLATLVRLVLQHKQWLVLQHKQLVWNVSCNIGMTCVTTQTVALNCFLQHWYDLCYNTNSCFEMFLATLVWLVLQHKQLLWIVSYNIGMTCVTTQTVALKCFLQHWYDLCYNTNSCSEMFLATLVWLVLQHKQLVLNCFL